MFQNEKKPFLAIKNVIFQSPKNRIFPKGLTHAFGQKKEVCFLQLFSVKIGPEILLNSVRDGKETFFGSKKCNLSKSQKPHFSMLLVKKCVFFLELFSVKIRLEIMFNNVLERKETFFGHKKFSFSKSQKSHFPPFFQREFHACGQKMYFFFLSCFR